METKIYVAEVEKSTKVAESLAAFNAYKVSTIRESKDVELVAAQTFANGRYRYTCKVRCKGKRVARKLCKGCKGCTQKVCYKGRTSKRTAATIG